MTEEQIHDPLNFMRNLWGNMGFSLPGMVTPTFDLDELDKRIKDMKAVEGWLRMNLSMLQMTIQGLEMQRTTVSTVQAMGQMASQAAQSMQTEAPAAAAAPEKTAFSEAAMWPWQMMQQMREQMQHTAEAVAQAGHDDKPASKPAARKAKTDR
ncbi:MAG TPA: PhaM family polyhydroxyalkanoate granule multifunctional regulatory protein [Azonexus sp.]